MTERRSWWGRLRSTIKAFFSRDAVTHRLAETERAVKLAALEKPQSEADHGRLIGAAALLQSIGDSNAVVVVGSLLLIRRANPTAAGEVYIRTLSQSELIYLENHPALLRDPDALYLRFSGPEALPVEHAATSRST